MTSTQIDQSLLVGHADTHWRGRVRSVPSAGQSRGRRPGRLRSRLVATDVLAVCCGIAGVVLPAGWAGARLPLVLGGAAIGAVLTAALAGLYLSRVSSVRAVEFSRLSWVAIVATAAAGALRSAVAETPSPAVLAALVVSTFIWLVIGRSAYDAVLRECRRRGRYCRHVLVLGGGEEVEAIVSLIGDHAELGYRIDGILGSPPRPGWDGPPHLGAEVDVFEMLAATGANGVILTSTQFGSPRRDALVRALLDAGVHVQLTSGFGGMDPRRIRTAAIAHQALFYLERVRLRRSQIFLKRTLDLFLGVLMLLLAAPVLLTFALAIWLEDRGPVFFRQERVGRDGKPFTLLKLRSMTVDAPGREDELANARGGPLFKTANDPRVTRVGRLIRLTSIDELPQLLNVVRGQMSLVGPRPALPREVDQFDEELRTRLSVPPGLTGLWQVEARDNPSFAAYRRFDLYYVENWRMSLDFVILVLTFQVVVTRTLLGLGRRMWPASAGAAGDALEEIVLD